MNFLQGFQINQNQLNQLGQQTEQEYYKYSPKSFMGMGAAPSSYFMDADDYSNKVSSTKALITSAGQGRTKITVKVPGYKTLTKILGQKAYTVHGLDGIKEEKKEQFITLEFTEKEKLYYMIKDFHFGKIKLYLPTRLKQHEDIAKKAKRNRRKT